ncbi:hypothetical protein LSAT2_021923 [Lamellibrachia satsuma]|nr:hypothetical protein LSAT2_021923 [Lamellibrachia satsuma]
MSLHSCHGLPFVTVPGPITNLTVKAHSQEVMLSWQQPESTNGIIQQYVVYYSFIGRTTQVAVTTTDVTTNDRAVSRQERSLQEEDFTNVTTTDTHITVAHLQPSSMYSFSVTAETEAGQGPFTNVTMQTGPPISTVVVSSVTTAMAVIHTDQGEINTDVYEPVSSSAHQLSTAELVGLVIGAALLALLIIALVALLFVRCCCHDQQPQAGVFVLKSDDIVSRSSAGAPAAPSTVNTEELQNTNNDARGLGRSHAHHMTTQHNGALQQWPAQSRHSTHRHGPPGSDHCSPGAIQGHGVSPESPLRDRHVDPYHALDWLQQLNPQHLLMRERDASRPYQVESESAEAGFTNPAYDDKDEVNNQGTMPSATVCNRMRSGSAAAIAVQQTRNSAIFHDTDNLIANDSIVVYDQRTAL